MIYSVQQIKFEILAYIKEFGGDFNDWYVGIAADPKGTLFQTHKVHQEDDIWLHKQALTFTACKTIQKYFLEILKTDGEAISEGDEDTDCVYLYKKSNHTIP
ncbi:MAG: hypothetical protein GKR92_01625 [Gammaproteobacteria bacterium]|nr:MAG: hypothetical protein GKR92_01625 [Gammaproteobacteria bacterium]